VAAPIPCAAPVTTATRSVNLFMLSVPVPGAEVECDRWKVLLEKKCRYC